MYLFRSGSLQFSNRLRKLFFFVLLSCYLSLSLSLSVKLWRERHPSQLASRENDFLDPFRCFMSFCLGGAWIFDSRPENLTLGVIFCVESAFQVKNSQILEPGGKHKEKRNQSNFIELLLLSGTFREISDTFREISDTFGLLLLLL